MADARIIDVCDEIVAYLTTNWVGTAPTIERTYLPDFIAEEFTGPKVYVIGTAFPQVEMLDRTGDIDAYVVSVIYAEKSTDAGTPTTAWIDERMNRVDEQIYDRLKEHRVVLLDSKLWPESADVTTLYDYDFLKERNLFLSEVVFEFREVD